MILLDLNCEDIDPVQFCRLFYKNLKNQPDVPIVVFHHESPPPCFSELFLKAGGRGLVSLSAGSEQFVSEITKFLQGSFYEIGLTVVVQIGSRDCSILLRKLEQKGCNVRSADSPIEAIELAQKNMDLLIFADTETEQILHFISCLRDKRLADTCKTVLVKDGNIEHSMLLSAEGIRLMETSDLNSEETALKAIRIFEEFKIVKDFQKKNLKKKTVDLALERHTHALDLTRAGLWDWQIESGEIYYSSWCAKMLGYDVSNCSDGNFFKGLVHPHDRDNLLKETTACITRKREFYDLELRMKASSGEWLWIRAFARVVERNNFGKAIRMFGVFLDITGRKKSDEAANLFMTVFRKAEFGIAIADMKGNLLLTNKYFAEVHGYTTEELREKSLSVLHDEGQMGQVEVLIDQLIEKGTFSAREVGHIRKDGNAFPMMMTGILIKDHEGLPQYMACTAIDLTERQNLENQLRHSQKLDSLGRLAGGVAHDFNNMLNVISGNTELAIDLISRDNPIYHHLLEIQMASERSATLSRQLLTFSSGLKTRAELVDLNQNIKSMLRMLCRLIGENVKLKFVNGDEDLKIMISPGQMDQILANLCVNARDALAGSGEIEIRTFLEYLGPAACQKNMIDEPRYYAVLTVRDNGSGMDRCTLSKVFEPFFTTKPAGKGTGLGLATVYGIVKQHKGVISIDSEKGTGTVVKIGFLNLKNEAQIENGEELVKDYLPTEEKCVLLVEDEDSILRVAEKLLKRLGYCVHATTSPIKAIEIFEENPARFDLIMTDVVMPGMNGKQLFEALKSKSPALRSLFVSGYASGIVSSYGVATEKENFIYKPYNLLELAKKLKLLTDA